MDGLKWGTMTRDNHLTDTECKTCLKGTERTLPSVQLSLQTISSESRRNRPVKYQDVNAKQPRYVLTRPCDQFRSPNNAVRISLGKGWTTEELWFDSRDSLLRHPARSWDSSSLLLVHPPLTGTILRLANGKHPTAHSRINAMKSASFENLIPYGLQCVHYTTKTSMVTFSTKKVHISVFIL